MGKNTSNREISIHASRLGFVGSHSRMRIHDRYGCVHHDNAVCMEFHLMFDFCLVLSFEVTPIKMAQSPEQMDEPNKLNPKMGEKELFWEGLWG